MSPNPRAFRLADQIQFEVSDILRNRLRDPRKGFITITAVEVADDLRSAKIFVSALGDDNALPEALALLDRARGFIRTELASRIQVRFVPEIHFRADDSASGKRRDEGQARATHLIEQRGVPPRDRVVEKEQRRHQDRGVKRDQEEVAAEQAGEGSLSSAS